MHIVAVCLSPAAVSTARIFLFVAASAGGDGAKLTSGEIRALAFGRRLASKASKIETSFATTTGCPRA